MKIAVRKLLMFAMSPPLAALHELQKRSEVREIETEYGDSIDLNEGMGGAVEVSGATFAVLVVVVLAFAFATWVYPMYKAFTCADPNSFAWGLLIFFGPGIMGIIYLLAVGCKEPN